jgi:hypothetical protein
MESPVDDPLKTIESFNRQFNLNQPQKDAVEWAFAAGIGEYDVCCGKYVYAGVTV